ncbi:exodeoxyribonuclease III [Thioclava pacifica DSM 10166]|uniref:Exodeoxyribonuclease III n=2 Tax=Thioclava pacifica TaxID=285109 RepID=A0A074JXX9_9RHOB|nr:exodeoxyribonuclease III [Thioclava pacifica DSM 10166]
MRPPFDMIARLLKQERKMSFTLATWNINSVRLREGLVCKLMTEEAPDVLCLQECKSPVEKIPVEAFKALGYEHMVARGQKGYNGVAILSKIPMEEVAAHDFADLNHARHVAATLENGVTVHNFYVPAGGDVPDREVNEKFGQKLDYLTQMRDHFAAETPKKAILVGDLNIAPREDDVWSHKQLLKIVSHTPIEVEHLTDVMEAGKWVDVTRQDIPEGLLYSWWSYRARDWDAADKGRRLDHIWATPDISNAAHGSRVLRAARGWEQPSDHAPVFATFDL